MNNFVKILYYMLKSLDSLIYLILKRKIIIRLLDKIKHESYAEKKILDRSLKFYTPSSKSLWRINNFFLNEPETIKWIDDFKNINNLVF